MSKLLISLILSLSSLEPALDGFTELKSEILTIAGNVAVVCPFDNLPTYWNDVVYSKDGRDIVVSFNNNDVNAFYVELTTNETEDVECAFVKCYFAPNDMLAISVGDIACMFGEVAPLHNYAFTGSTFEELRLTHCIIYNTPDHYFGNFLVETVDVGSRSKEKLAIKRNRTVGQFFGEVEFAE